MKHVQVGSMSFSMFSMKIIGGTSGPISINGESAAAVTCSCGWKSENALTPDEAAEQFAAHQVAGKGRARR